MAISNLFFALEIKCLLPNLPSFIRRVLFCACAETQRWIAGG